MEPSPKVLHAQQLFVLLSLMVLLSFQMVSVKSALFQRIVLIQKSYAISDNHDNMANEQHDMKLFLDSIWDLLSCNGTCVCDIGSEVTCDTEFRSTCDTVYGVYTHHGPWPIYSHAVLYIMERSKANRQNIVSMRESLDWNLITLGSGPKGRGGRITSRVVR